MNQTETRRPLALAAAILFSGLLTMQSPVARAASPPPCAQLLAGVRTEIQPYRGDTPTQDLASVKTTLSAAFAAVKRTGLKLPDRLLVFVNPIAYTWSSGYRAAHGNTPAQIITTHDLAALYHELGHILFVTNLMLEPAPFIQVMQTAEQQLTRLEAEFHSHTQSLTDHTGYLEVGTPGWEQYDQLRQVLLQKHEELETRGAAAFLSSDFFRAYDELMADTVSFAFTGLERGNCDPETDEWKSLPEAWQKILRVGRDFGARIQPTDWGNEEIHQSPYLFFGPTRSYIGEHMPKGPLSARLKYIKKVYRAVIEDMATQIPGARDTVTANQRLIERLR